MVPPPPMPLCVPILSNVSAHSAPVSPTPYHLTIISHNLEWCERNFKRFICVPSILPTTTAIRRRKCNSAVLRRGAMPPSTRGFGRNIDSCTGTRRQQRQREETLQEEPTEIHDNTLLRLRGDGSRNPQQLHDPRGTAMQPQSYRLTQQDMVTLPPELLFFSGG